LNTRLVPIPGIHHFGPIASPLGLLSALPGKWTGTGFNQIFRPVAQPAATDNFLELNLTDETLEFTEIGGEIPNRGFAQADISLFGMTYLQQVADHNVKDSQGNPAGIHIEPGIWVNIPATTAPAQGATVARLSNIPHGTSLVAQGTAQVIAGPPQIPAVDITPFFIGNPAGKVPFPDRTNLSNPSPDRSPDADIVGITQSMVDDPNSVLRNALVGKTINSHTVIQISTKASTNTSPATGGGISDIAFLDGAGQSNADVVQMDATFWISDFIDSHGAQGTMLQYSQVVLLNFAPLSWPHVSVANLFKPIQKSLGKDVKDAKDHKNELKEHKNETKEHLKPEIKETLKHEGKEIIKHEVKEVEQQVPQFPPPNPGDPIAIGPAGPAGPEAAGSAARHFIAPAERPIVGDPAAVAKPPVAPDVEKPQ
jgi:hypothetical protein